MLKGILSFIMAFLYGVLYRMKGGMRPKLPCRLDEILIALPIGYLAYIVSGGSYFWFIGVFIASFIAKLKGHEQYFNLIPSKTIPIRVEPEFWDIFVKPLFGKDPRSVSYWESLAPSSKIYAIDSYGYNKLKLRCLFGLSVSGSAVGLGLSICLIYHLHILLGLVTILSFGLLKALGYQIGIFIAKTKLSLFNNQVFNHTEWGKLISGFLTGFLLIYIYCLTFF